MPNVEALIKSLGDWTEPKRVHTKFGPRDLRQAASVKPEFWDAWNAHKADLKSAGISIKKNDKGQWEINWWANIPEAERQHMATSLVESRAVDADIVIPVPDGLSYLPFQKAGIKFASGRFHFSERKLSTLIADEMGLGKTIQALGLINLESEIKSVAIVCPASLKLNWEREARKWLVRNQSIGIATSKEIPDTEIVIVNYDKLNKLIDGLEARGFDLVVADECHYIKNPKSLRSKAFYRLADSAKHNLLLSGTPMVNRPLELFPLLSILDKDTWNKNNKGFFSYAKKFCGAYKDRFGWHFDGATNLDQLQVRLRSTVMIRRLKKDVLAELPAKFRQIIEFSDSTIIRKESGAIEYVENSIEALRTAVELAKASDNPQDYDDAVDALNEGIEVAFSEIAKIRHDTALAKVPLVVEHIKNVIEDGRKVVVFAHHRDVQDALMAEFGNIAVLHRGGMSDEAKDEVVFKFQTDPKIKIFVGSIKASGVGITLTAASHVIFVELDYVPGNMSQAEDRCHRIGQKNFVLVQHLVLEGSIDANMAMTLVEKQKIIDLALDKEPVTNVAPTRERGATMSTSRKQIEEIAAKLTAQEIKEIHTNLKRLASMCDGANALDGYGFNKIDAPIGHALARALFLTPKQAALGSKIVRKYRRQLIPKEETENAS